jgi:DNA-binding NtrC family response regulator
MPGRDGMSLMREVKEKWPEVPVIIMSGYVTNETVTQVSKTDAASFIAKPFTPDELAEAIRKVLEKEGSHE